MKPTPHKNAAFTLIELLVVISIIAILATLIAPALKKAMDGGHMTQTLNNARQLQLATQTMTSETLQAGQGVEWTSVNDPSGTARAATVSEYFDALLANNGISKNDLKRLLSAPGKGPGTSEPNASNSCFKFFWVKDSSPSDQPLLVTSNWSAGGLSAEANPYGKNGFVVFNKGGGGIVSHRVADATSLTYFPTDTENGYTTQILN
jgi:prepilin-type N-terminal cleavage/methylation domain-containing protein